MEFQLRPQWRQWNYNRCQQPMCGRCGIAHPTTICRATNQKCLRCIKLGHFARMCRSKLNSQTKENDTNAKQITVKPLKKRERDVNRLQKYVQTKNLMRELPFSNIRDSNFRKTLNLDSVLRQELSIIKQKCKEQNSNHGSHKN